jgi:hypothetical protein
MMNFPNNRPRIDGKAPIACFRPSDKVVEDVDLEQVIQTTQSARGVQSEKNIQNVWDHIDYINRSIKEFAKEGKTTLHYYANESDYDKDHSFFFRLSQYYRTKGFKTDYIKPSSVLSKYREIGIKISWPESLREHERLRNTGKYK